MGLLLLFLNELISKRSVSVVIPNNVDVTHMNKSSLGASLILKSVTGPEIRTWFVNHCLGKECLRFTIRSETAADDNKHLGTMYEYHHNLF